MTDKNVKQTTSEEKIAALQERIEKTEEDLKQSERILDTMEPEQRRAAETKNERRRKAISEAQNRMNNEFQEMEYERNPRENEERM